MKKVIKSTLAGLIGFMLLLSCESKKASMESTDQPASQEKVEIRSIDSKEAKTILEKHQDIVILDVRTPKEFSAGHVTGAQNVDFQGEDFTEQLQLLNPDQEYLIYCAIGGRSGKAMKQMEKMGFKKVLNVADGFPGLSDKGIPVTKNK